MVLPEIAYWNSIRHKIGITAITVEIHEIKFSFCLFFPPLTGALDKSVIESELQGSFTDLRKALFVVDSEDSPLLASVLDRAFYFREL